MRTETHHVALSAATALIVLMLLSLAASAQTSASEEKSLSQGTKYGLISDSLDSLAVSGGEPVSFRGRLDATSPTFDRRIGLTTDLACNASSSDSANNGMYYAAIPIRLAAAENLVAEIVDLGTSPIDTYLHLYCDPFDPAAPEAGLIATDDDGGYGVLSAFTESDGLLLSPGETYWIVVTTFSGGAVGDFHLQVANTLLPSIGKDSGAELEGFSWPYLGVGTANPSSELHVVGDTVLDGDVAMGSSREMKTAFLPARSTELLAELRELPLFTWSYRTDSSAARHLGPVAEDFHARFGLGRDERHISPADTAGLALAAIQGLSAVVEEKDAEIHALRSRVETLERAVRALSENLRVEQETSLTPTRVWPAIADDCKRTQEPADTRTAKEPSQPRSCNPTR